MTEMSDEVGQKIVVLRDLLREIEAVHVKEGMTKPNATFDTIRNALLVASLHLDKHFSAKVGATFGAMPTDEVREMMHNLLDMALSDFEHNISIQRAKRSS